jgi:hypothetical protein
VDTGIAGISSSLQVGGGCRGASPRVLGDEIREVDRGQLVERINELEHLLRTAHTDLADTRKTVAALTDQNQELTEQLDAVRILNQQLIRQSNGLEPHEPHKSETARNIL